METLILIASVVLMVIFFGLCIIVHEFGHFIVAKFCGLHIEAFSVGFKKIWGKKINGVDYRIGCIPCGGYVDLPQIDSTSDEIRDSEGNLLPRAEPWKRIATAFAGPFFNIIFGLLLGTVVWIAGVPQPDTDHYTEFTVRFVPENCPEYRAGLREGDRIVKLNGKEFDLSWNDFMQRIMLNEDNVEQVTLEVVRGGETAEIVYTPEANDTLMTGENVKTPFFRPEMRVYVFPLPGSAAKKAGLQPEDIVTAVDGVPVYGSDELMTRINFSDGKTLKLTVERGGKTLEIPVTPTKVPGAEARPMVGINFSAANARCEVLETLPGLPAADVLRAGDVIVSFNGQALKDNPAKFSELVSENGEKEAELAVERGGETIEVKLSPRIVVLHEIGVGFYRIVHPSPLDQLVKVLKMTQRTLKSLGHSIQSKVGTSTGYTTIGVQNLSGPLGIGRYMIMTFQTSFLSGLYLVVVISFSLGLFNLLPVPVLDGGHIMIALIEIIIRRPVPTKLVQPVTYFFMVVLIGFMVIVSFYDVKKMIPPRWSDALELKIHRAASETGEDAAEPETVKAAEAAAETAEKAEIEKMKIQVELEAAGETAIE
jgi:membrane-associated protease RseP (regulator of RpoE activity)